MVAVQERPLAQVLPASGTATTEPVAVAGLPRQGSLLAVGEPEVDTTFGGLLRRDLGEGAWVDHVPGWVTGADALFDHLLAQAPWQAREVPMYGQLVAQPRLSAWWGEDLGAVPPIVRTMRQVLADRYGGPFGGIGANLYRDGRDSVAWHGDRDLRRQVEATVAVVSLGSPRRFLLRPTPGVGSGPSVRLQLHPGDLLVMGGTCQRTWQHCVPKTAGHVGPRISVTFRRRPRT